MPALLSRTLPESIHFIGVCGTAMAGVAAELHARGVRVTGSDKAAYPPMSTYLAQRGVSVREGYDPAHLDPAPALVVVGNAISRGNPELEAVLDRRLPFCSLPELLEALFLPAADPLVVTGTHGKTTTTALCAWMLREAGQDPSWLIGGVPAGLEGAFHLGGGRPFVLEGDEYDTAFFDKRPKFLHYRPQVLILNNIEFDHADIYPDLSRIREVFGHLTRILPRGGLVVANADDDEVMRLAPLCPCPVVTYSLSGKAADWMGEASPGRLIARGPGGLSLALAHGLVGAHQGYNLLAAAVAVQRFGVAPERIGEAVASFRGVKRRAEKVGEAAGVAVYDDFAHHPTAIRGTLRGFRDLFPNRRLVAVVEPRSNTMRRKVFQQDLVEAFDAADLLLLRAVPDAAKVPPGELLDVAELAAAVSARGIPAALHPDADAIVSALSGELREGDVVVVLSNGGFEGIHAKLLAMLGQKG